MWGTRIERSRGMPGFNFDPFASMTICGPGLCSPHITTAQLPMLDYAPTAKAVTGGAPRARGLRLPRPGLLQAPGGAVAHEACWAAKHPSMGGPRRKLQVR